MHIFGFLRGASAPVAPPWIRPWVIYRGEAEANWLMPTGFSAILDKHRKMQRYIDQRAHINIDIDKSLQGIGLPPKIFQTCAQDVGLAADPEFLLRGAERN